MPRPRHRVCLESGLKLDLNYLVRRGFVRPGWQTGLVSIPRTEQPAFALINADMRGPTKGWLQIQIDGVVQDITLRSDRRHFGGRQWYFECPYLHRRASVLWRPPGATYFACRQRWDRQVAYASQFMDRIDRAHWGKARINQSLCRKGGFDPDDWDFPPKPKWMRWRTYNRAEEKFDQYEANWAEGMLQLMAKL